MKLQINLRIILNCFQFERGRTARALLKRLLEEKRIEEERIRKEREEEERRKEEERRRWAVFNSENGCMPFPSCNCEDDFTHSFDPSISVKHFVNPGGSF